MSFTDILAGDIAPELLKLLVLVASTVYGCKGIAERLIRLISDVQPTIREIQYSGVELSQHRQTQLRMFFEILEKARKLSEKVLRCKRYNPKHIYHASKMKDLERKITRFLSTSVLVNILADVNGSRFICEAGIERVEKKCDRLMERMDCLSLAEAMKRAEATVEIETEADPAIQREGLDLGKREMKEMMSKFPNAPLFGISGMGGSGKTTLAQEICRDNDVRGLYNKSFVF